MVGFAIPRELFRKHGIAYDSAKQTNSELFRDLLPLLNSSRIVLPCNDRLLGHIVGLKRRTSAVGRDTISHPDRGHDDVANAVAGRRRCPNSADTIRASAGCRVTTTTPGLRRPPVGFSNRTLKVLATRSRTARWIS